MVFPLTAGVSFADKFTVLPYVSVNGLTDRVVAMTGGSPTAKSAAAAADKPVACVLVGVLVPVVGDVQPAAYRCTIKLAVFAPPITSPGTKLKVAS